MIRMAKVTPERIERVKAAFTDAADADASSRQRIVERLERDDPEVAELLRQLLRTHDDPHGDLFKEPVIRLEQALAEPENAVGSAPSLGKKYRIIRLLGCGGVGDVYLAKEDTPIERQVAIKVFRPHRLDGQRLRRFGIEARALGTLSHPGIAQVYGAGEAADGRPYLAMEYVPGLPIDQACAEAGLDERAILQLFTELCEAVQHAHQRGVIHRDLKPSNVLVVRKGDVHQVKVIDFGVAKLADEAGANLGSLTLHGQILGTLDYMSPEQWRGTQADTRSDVYSLAVILYRLLTKRMPFGENTMASRGATDDARPAPMENVPGWIRRDIETIIGKAMAFEPANRYASPLHMAEDINRLLQGEPVLARRTTPLERTIKLFRRHPRVTVLTGLLLAVIVAIAAQLVISHQKMHDEVEMQRAMIVGLLDEVLDRLYVMTGAMETREAMATSLLDRTDQLLLTAPNDPDLKEARARLLMELGKILEERRDRTHARIYLAKSENIFAELTALPHADVDTWRRYAECIVRHAGTFGWTEAAVKRIRDAHEVLEFLAAKHPNHPGVLDDLCWSHDRIANILRWRGEFDQVYRIHLQRLDLAYILLALDEDRVLSHYNLMMAHFQLASHYFRVWEEDSLQDHLQKAMSYGEWITVMEPARIHYRRSFVELLLLQARTAMQREDFEEVEANFDRLDVMTAKLYQDNPGNHYGIQGRVRALIEHAHAALTFAEHDRVQELYQRATEIAERYPEYMDSDRRRLLRELDSQLASKK